MIYNQNTADTFCYTIINNEATVTGFKGEPQYIVIPDTIANCPVTEIRDNAFYKCDSLKQIRLPQTLERIGHHCFYGCTSLESIDLPQNLVSIAMGCFYGCSKLSYVSFPENIKVIPDSCFRYCSSLVEIILPQSVETIEKFAFACCDKLNRVSLSGKTSSIGDYAFYICDSLKEMYIPASVETFGTEAVGFKSDKYGHVIINGFSICGEADSPAEQYASENNIAFITEADSRSAFAEQHIFNPPVDVPDIFFDGGLLFLILAFVSLIRGKIKRKP